MLGFVTTHNFSKQLSAPKMGVGLQGSLMITSKKELPFLTTYMTMLLVLLVLLGSSWILSLIGFEYNVWTDPFDIIKLIIRLITMCFLYFIGIKFFSWLYSASPQKTKE